MTGHAPQIVTFSGIDGAGKTTQIERISAHLILQGYRVARVSFWDDVACMSNLRAGISLAVLQKEQAPRHQIALRNDKNVHTWYLMFIRAVFYLLDALRLRRIVSQLRIGNHDFVIFDRYLYDQLAQFHSRRWLARAYIRLLAGLAPKPEFAFILDALPDEAFSRKPEYPLAFMYNYRREFLGLSKFIPHLVVIGPSSVENVHKRILERLSEGSDVFVNASPVG
jgi:thymidylate kinase